MLDKEAKTAKESLEEKKDRAEYHQHTYDRKGQNREVREWSSIKRRVEDQEQTLEVHRCEQEREKRKRANMNRLSPIRQK